MALAIEIADAVAAELAAGQFSQDFTPQRRVLPMFELAELTELHVTVVPKAVEIKLTPVAFPPGRLRLCTSRLIQSD